MLVVLGVLALFTTMFFSTETFAQNCNTDRGYSSANNNAYIYEQNNGYYGNYNNNYDIDHHQYNHRQRIIEGIRSGQLTPAEVARLRQQEALIRRYEAIAKRDGFITYQEQMRINRELDLLSRQIHQEKHDSETVFNSRNDYRYNSQGYDSRNYRRW